MNIVRRDIMVALLLLLTGCTKEDISMCVGTPTVGVKFSYTHNADRVDKFPSQVKAVSLFAFNEQGACVARLRETGEKLASNYVMPLEGLAPGKYRLVAWGGGSDTPSYTLHEEQPDGSLTEFSAASTPIERARTVLKHQNGVIGDTPTELYHGMVSEVVIVDGESQIIEIPMIKNTNLIRSTIKGLPVTRGEGGAFETKITAANGRFSFANEIAPTAKQLTYLPYNVQIKNERLYGENRVLRMQKEVPMLLIVTDTRTGREIAKFNIIKLLLDIPGNGIESNDDLDRYDIYDITVDVSNYQRELVVTINGWTIKIVTGGME